MNKPKIVFITESIRRDAHAPLKNFKQMEVIHLYLSAPYGDMTAEDLVGARKVELDNMVEEIFKVAPDVIQGTEPFGSKLSLKLSMISLRAKKKTGAKLIVPVLENRPIGERFNLLQRIVLGIFCPIYFKNVDCFIALNKGAVSNIKHYYRRAKIVTNIIWGVWGVDLDFFKPSAKKVPQTILYVGRLIEDKGLNYLIRGFSEAQKQVPGLTLSFVGSGLLQGELESFARENGIASKVKFLGYKKNKELPEIFSAAELVAYPSITMKRWEEQVGTVNFQALACGTPILTTRSGAIAEYITDGRGAILVKEKSVDELAQAIVRFFTDARLREKLTHQARTAAAEYDIKKEVARAEKLALSLIND